jgi:glycosyltransferase involved in cell wall biosynthesis
MFTEPVNWPHPDTPLYKIGSFMEYSVMHHSDCVLASSHYTATFCATRYHYPIGDIQVIHSGIDTQKFSPRARPDGDGNPRLLFVGTILESKGIVLLVNSVINLIERYPNIRLRIVGKGTPSICRRLAKLIEGAGAQSNFELVGYVPYEEISEHFAWCDVFALPSIREPGPGNVYLEAMACGKPVIGCTTGGTPEIVLDQQTGLLVAPRDSASLEAAIVALADDPAFRQRLGMAGRERVEEHFSVEQYLNKVEGIYEELLHPAWSSRIQTLGSSLEGKLSSLERRVREDAPYPWSSFLSAPHSSSTLKRLTRLWRHPQGSRR